MIRSVYMDNAATTPVADEVARAMKPYMKENYGNPSGVYALAKKSRQAVETARAAIAETLHTEPETIFFTSGGTESDNWALRAAIEYGLQNSYAAANGSRSLCAAKGRHIITTKIEHHAVLNTCHYLERHGTEVTYLNVDKEGFVAPEAVEAAIRPETVLVSVMTANNEIGTIEPVNEIGKLVRTAGILFHTDAVQAYGHIPVDVKACGADMLSASAHKFNGPKGTGFLYMREPRRFKALMYGGAQEGGLRAGTENVAGIVGMGCAAALAEKRMKHSGAYEKKLRDRLIYRLRSELPYVRLNGSRESRLPNNASFCFAGADSTSMLLMLDMAGISASGGSACASGDKSPSHVLKALGLSDDEASTALRLTISDKLTPEDIDYAVIQIKRIVNYLRQAGS